MKKKSISSSPSPEAKPNEFQESANPQAGASLKRYTAMEIAQRAGVSHITAARVLSMSDKYSVKPETRAKVLKVAAELGYVPNPFARSLRDRRSHIIGLCGIVQPLFGDVDGQQVVYYYDINTRMRGISMTPESHDYKVMIIPRDNEDPQMEEKLWRDIQFLDGLIYINPKLGQEPILTRLAQRIPLVVELGGELQGVSNVSADEYHGMIQALELLTNKGYRRLGLIQQYDELFSNARQRIGAFRDYHRNRGVTRENWQIVTNSSMPQEVYDVTRRMVSMKNPIEALIAPPKEWLQAAIEAIRDCGKTIGREVGLIALNDREVAPTHNPGITTLLIPHGEISAQSFRRLLQQIEDPGKAPTHQVVPMALLERESTCGRNL